MGWRMDKIVSIVIILACVSGFALLARERRCGGEICSVSVWDDATSEQSETSSPALLFRTARGPTRSEADLRDEHKDDNSLMRTVIDKENIVDVDVNRRVVVLRNDHEMLELKTAIATSPGAGRRSSERTSGQCPRLWRDADERVPEASQSDSIYTMLSNMRDFFNKAHCERQYGFGIVEALLQVKGDVKYVRHGKEESDPSEKHDSFFVFVVMQNATAAGDKRGYTLTAPTTPSIPLAVPAAVRTFSRIVRKAPRLGDCARTLSLPALVFELGNLWNPCHLNDILAMLVPALAVAERLFRVQGLGAFQLVMTSFPRNDQGKERTPAAVRMAGLLSLLSPTRPVLCLEPIPPRVKAILESKRPVVPFPVEFVGGQICAPEMLYVHRAPFVSWFPQSGAPHQCPSSIVRVYSQLMRQGISHQSITGGIAELRGLPNVLFMSRSMGVTKSGSDAVWQEMRALNNQDDVIRALRARCGEGLCRYSDTFFHNTSMSGLEQATILYSVDILVGVHGGGLGWLPLLPPGAVHVALRPPIGSYLFENLAVEMGFGVEVVPYKRKVVDVKAVVHALERAVRHWECRGGGRWRT